MSTDPETIRNYNESAHQYHDHVSDTKQSPYHSMYEKPAILAEIPDLTGQQVISIGCGSGVDTKPLKARGAKRVVGVDISEGLIAIAKHEQPDDDFYVMDMEHLDFPDETFHIAYSSLAIHYLPTWLTALKEAHRVLKPGGQYIFSCGHPFDGALERGENENGRYALLGLQRTSETKILYGDYFAVETDGIKKLRGVLQTTDVLCYHRPISAMYQDIIDAGFTVSKIVEPLPLKELNAMDAHTYDRLNRIPAFMIFVCKKI